MSRFPLRYAHLNILVGRGDDRAALFRLDTVSYPFLAEADKRDWLRLRVRARRRSCGRVVAHEHEPIPWDGELAMRYDSADTQLHRGRVTGPARVTFTVPARLTDRGGRLVACQEREGERGHAVVLCARETMEVRA